MIKISAKDRRVLFIPDTHIPYHHVDAIRFLQAVKKKYIRPNDLVIHLGDEVDQHALSFHDSDSELFSAGDEGLKSIEFIHRKGGLHDMFPQLKLLESNHGSLVYRKGKHHGIPLYYFKSYGDLLQTPEWTWHDGILIITKIGPVFVCHGKSSGYGKMVEKKGVSCVQGHFHTKFEITWHRTVMGDRFNMFSGCLINAKSLAFAYAKNDLEEAILGVSLLSSAGYPWQVKMELNGGGRWTGRLP